MSRIGLGRPRGWFGWAAAALAVGKVLNGLRLRDRLARIPTLEPAGAFGHTATDGEAPAGPAASRWGVVTAAGVTVDDATFTAAVAHAEAEGLLVLDLVPGDLPGDRALDLARDVDPQTYRTTRLAPGRGARHVTVADADLLARAGLSGATGLDPVEMSLATIRLKQFAPTGTDLAIAPGLVAVPVDPAKRLPYLRSVSSVAAPAVAATPLLHSAIGAGAALTGNLAWATAAHLAAALQSTVATAGTPLAATSQRPLDLLLAPPRAALDAVRTLRSRWASGAEQPSDPDAVARLRPSYDGAFDRPQRYLEAPRSDCPHCGSPSIGERITTPDLLQHKPGTFRIDGCRSCGHLFQNPRLTIEGLDVSYRDFYDGLGAGESDFIFALSDRSYRDRARVVADAVAGGPPPRRWLDVGAGHGHFCLIAAEELPATRFDGIDLSSSIDEAAARGWVSTGHRGLLPDLAEDLAGAYDVVSMFHCLEHTRDPWAELDAARTVLEPGGHLLIEVPNPDCPFPRWAGRYWMPWFQPQHQHFLSVDNLTSSLRDRGFEVLATELGPAHQPVDAAFLPYLVFQHLAPAPDRPWLPPRTTAQRIGRKVAFALSLPLSALGLVVDLATAPLVRRSPRASNAYRLLARRTG
jgi:SAM-dependent methyltransferase